MFDTPEADAILDALQIFPPDNPWNQDISGLPVHKDSAAMIAGIGADKPLQYNLDMNFIIVPADQKRVEVKILDYPDESDPGPFPLPDNAPIENWPLTRNENTKALPRPGQTLEQFQREAEGDRHIILVDPGNGKFHEFWQAKRTDAGWQASNAATWDLRTGALSAGALDLGGRRGPAHLSRGRALRRVRAGHGRARDAVHRVARRAAPTSCPPPTGRARATTRTCRGWASASVCARTSTSRAFRPTCRPS